MPKTSPANPPHLVKRYSPGRLYDTSSLAYVDAAQLRALQRSGEQVVVVEAKTGQDITDSVLRHEP